MAGGFRRAELPGSDELFRPTRPDEDVERRPVSPSPPRPEAPRVTAATEAAMEVRAGTGAAPRPDGHLLRLTDEELDILAEAVQRLKYPTSKPVTKPPMELFERLEDLRKKLLGAE